MKAKRQNTKSTFCVIFVIQKGKCRPDGTAPIVARITLNGEMVHFALNKRAWVNVFLRIARGEEIQPENDAEIAAELVRHDG